MVCRQAAPVAQLLRRFGEAGIRGIGTRAYPTAHHRTSQTFACQWTDDREPDGIRLGVQIPQSFEPYIQASNGNFTE